MASARDITRAVCPPRSVYLDYPLGHTAGRPNDPQINSAIMTDTLAAFEALDVPGSMTHLRYRWADSDDWKKKVFAPQDGEWGESAADGAAANGAAGAASAVPPGDYLDDRVERHDTPQYQTQLDADTAAELHSEQECLVCAGIDY